MAQFPIEDPDNSKTSGNGQFLSDDMAEYINFFESEIPRCEGFLVDRPPHNSFYFRQQLEAVGKYYEKISKGKLNYTVKIIDNPDSTNGYYTVSNAMEYYAKGDSLLAEFFSEALDSAKLDLDAYIEEKNIALNEVVFVVFHAGLGQDFSYPSLDPTIYDLKSAYIDKEMMQGVTPTVISNDSIYTGILLPETQNIIYYNVVEDIFGNPDYETDDLCDIQVGMTGIFSMLLGYELGLPPMFNTENGDPGVGFFGLMDHGSNNGRGVIPAPPTPWTRIKGGWSEEVNIHSRDNLDSILVRFYNSLDTIYRINIAEDEYFLIENRNNWALPETDIDSLRRKHKINENKMGHWFDVVTDSNEVFVKNDLIDINAGVITRFDHYDYGLPGSGILIYHIKEPDEEQYSSGINNDRYNRHVQIEEADGAADIGFESYTFFASANPTTGTRWDMWFKGNEAYEFGNPYAEKVVFDNRSNPNTRTIGGAASYVSIEVLSEISDSMYIKITFEDGIDIIQLSEEPVQYLGNAYAFDSTAAVFYEKEEVIYKHSSNSIIDTMDNLSYDVEKLIYTYAYEDQIEYFAGDTCINPICENFVNGTVTHGYIESQLDSIPVPGALSLGDLDLDGLDEIITIDEDGNIIARNSNETLVNGYPVNGNFSGVPLIANILPSEYGKDIGKPEIVCREGNNIVILSNRGERLRQLSSYDIDQPLAMVPFWDRNKMALIDGSRLFLFDLDMDHSYWLNPKSRPSGFPMSTGKHFDPENRELMQRKAYNYPNPITEGHTTFRFFVGSTSGKIQVRIYDAAGFLVKDDLELINGDENEFNEIVWDNIQVDAGLYLAEIKRDVGKSELVRLVVIK